MHYTKLHFYVSVFIFCADINYHEEDINSLIVLLYYKTY